MSNQTNTDLYERGYEMVEQCDNAPGGEVKALKFALEAGNLDDIRSLTHTLERYLEYTEIIQERDTY